MRPLQREKMERNVVRTINADLAANAVGPISRGCEIFGVCKGQFSLVELIEHCLDYTGPASLILSTWTVGGADISHFAHLVANKAIRKAMWFLDSSFPERQPDYCDQLVEAFGAENIICSSNHAKFVLFKNSDWNLVLLSSMNLNKNRRLETYSIHDDAGMLEYLWQVAIGAFQEGCSVAATLENSHRADKTINRVCGQVEKRPPDIRAGGHPLIRGKQLDAKNF